MKKGKRSLIYFLSRKLHLLVGLSVGLIIFIVSISGAILVFQDEIKEYLRKDAIYLSSKDIQGNNTVLPISQLISKVEQSTGKKEPLSWINIPIKKNKAYQFKFYDRDFSQWNYYKEFKVYKTAYVNPYTGEVIEIYNEKNDFFFIMLRLHFALLLGTHIGSWIVGISVILFIFMLVTGIILWWPKNKRMLKHRMSFRWKNIKNWRRKNYDLHSILGFYSSFIALIIAISGLYFTFDIVPKIYYFISSGGETEIFNPQKQLVIKRNEKLPKEIVLDKITEKIERLYPDAYSYRLTIKPKKKTEESIINIRVKQNPYNYNIQNKAYFNKNNGELLLDRRYDNLNNGEKMLLANYDIHTGSILGLGTKVLAFIVSLICASLPVTGFLVWWGRTRKKRYKK